MDQIGKLFNTRYEQFLIKTDITSVLIFLIQNLRSKNVVSNQIVRIFSTAITVLESFCILCLCGKSGVRWDSPIPSCFDRVSSYLGCLEAKLSRIRVALHPGCHAFRLPRTQTVSYPGWLVSG